MAGPAPVFLVEPPRSSAVDWITSTPSTTSVGDAWLSAFFSMPCGAPISAGLAINCFLRRGLNRAVPRLITWDSAIVCSRFSLLAPSSA